MGDGQRLKEFKFKIEEPSDKVMCTIITLLGWDRDGLKFSGGRSYKCKHQKEYVIQMQWFPWLYKRNIESAKRKLIKKYLKYEQPRVAKEWTEGCRTGPYEDNSEEALLLEKK